MCKGGAGGVGGTGVAGGLGGGLGGGPGRRSGSVAGPTARGGLGGGPGRRNRCAGSESVGLAGPRGASMGSAAAAGSEGVGAAGDMGHCAVGEYCDTGDHGNGVGAVLTGASVLSTSPPAGSLSRLALT